MNDQQNPSHFLKVCKPLVALVLAVSMALGLTGCALDPALLEQLGTQLMEEEPLQEKPLETLPPVELPDDLPYLPEEPFLGYYGKRLSQEDQELYLKILQGIMNAEPEIRDLAIQSEDQLKNINMSVVRDHGEIFWYRGTATFSGYQYGKTMKANLMPEYEYGPEALPGMIRQLMENTEPLIQFLDGKTDYEKVKGVYDYLIDHTEYDMDYKGKGMCELFSEGRAVCEGYARAAQYLLWRLDIPSIYVTGISANPQGGDMPHAWNMVQIEGDYCWLDVTWGDPYNPDLPPSKSYYYLNTTDKQMVLTHVPEDPDLPECNTSRWNYYRTENQYLTVYSKKDLENMFYLADQEGETSVEFQVSDYELYEKFQDQLFEKKEIHKILRQATGRRRDIRYRTYDPLQVITVEWR